MEAFAGGRSWASCCKRCGCAEAEPVLSPLSFARFGHTSWGWATGVEPHGGSSRRCTIASSVLSHTVAAAAYETPVDRQDSCAAIGSPTRPDGTARRTAGHRTHYCTSASASPAAEHVQVRAPAKGAVKTAAYAVQCLHSCPVADHPAAAGCSDGSLRLMAEGGQVSACAEHAHVGCVISVRWNHLGTALVTGGEDGAVKTWSATAMVRACIATGEVPVYCLAWAPDNASVRT